jgi:hypothetical protein
MEFLVCGLLFFEKVFFFEACFLLCDLNAEVYTVQVRNRVTCESAALLRLICLRYFTEITLNECIVPPPGKMCTAVREGLYTVGTARARRRGRFT